MGDRVRFALSSVASPVSSLAELVAAILRREAAPDRQGLFAGARLGAVGPGVTIGDGTVVGARSAVFKDLPAWVVAIGTPAKPVRARGLRPEDFEQTATKHEAGR